MLHDKKALAALIVSVNMLIFAIISMASRICFYLDAADGTYTTDFIYYVPKDLVVLYVISIVAEVLLLWRISDQK